MSFTVLIIGITYCEILGFHGGALEDIDFWDVTPPSLDEVDRLSEVRTVSIFRVMTQAVTHL
jgi:hypothetical protein